MSSNILNFQKVWNERGPTFFKIIVILIIAYFLYYLVKYYRFYNSIHGLLGDKGLYVSKEYKSQNVLEEDSKTITWLIHMYPPLHNAGAEWMAHAMNKYLVEKSGYKVNVVLNKNMVSEFERVHIIKKSNKVKVENAIQHSAVLVSHLDMEVHAVQSAIKAKRPIVLVMHNNYRKSFLQEYIRMMPKNIYLIHNSKWIKEYYSIFNIPSIVVYPPVDWREYRIDSTREYVTLINLNKNKGGDVLIKIAKAMPDVNFLGVKGGYDNQIIDDSVTNIHYIENTPYIKDVYATTNILLAPSKEESWGRVAVEAMSSGIPVIANPTPGLVESCGSAGIFCKREDIGSWVKEIRRLLNDKEYYQIKSDMCFERAKELDPEPQLKEMSSWLNTLKWIE